MRENYRFEVVDLGSKYMWKLTFVAEMGEIKTRVLTSQECVNRSSAKRSAISGIWACKRATAEIFQDGDKFCVRLRGANNRPFAWSPLVATREAAEDLLGFVRDAGQAVRPHGDSLIMPPRRARSGRKPGCPACASPAE